MTNKIKRYRVSYAECGDYEHLEDQFDNYEKALKFYNKIVKEKPNYWVDIVEIKKHRYCDEIE